MEKMTLKVKKFGNSWGIYLPPYMVKYLKLEGKQFDVKIEDGKIVQIGPIKSQ